jgi:PTH1 family peptidyl-tRNA hydrolase
MEQRRRINPGATLRKPGKVFRVRLLLVDVNDRGIPIYVDVIVGLGNPGRRYHRSRHNIGFDVVDALARRHGISIQCTEVSAVCGTGRIGQRSVLLAKPQTYMNASGEAVAPLVRRYIQAGEHLLVVHDDIDLPLGRIQYKRQGGDAGHRGIRSIIQCLQSGVFLRLRLGIGRPEHQEEVVDYVLSPFTTEEVEARCTMITQAVTWLEGFLEAPDEPSRA